MFSIFSIALSLTFWSSALMQISIKTSSSFISRTADSLFLPFLSNLAISASTLSTFPILSKAICLTSLYFALYANSSNIFGSVILDVAMVLTYLSLLSIAKSSKRSCDLISITAAILLFLLLCFFAISPKVLSFNISSFFLLSFLRRFSLANLMSSGPISFMESKSILSLSFLSFFKKSKKPIVSPKLTSYKYEILFLI